jgi:hypothetical protein
MLDRQNKLRRSGIITSFVIGLPVGLTTIALTLFAPTAISGEGLPTMGLIAVYGKAILGLIVAFVFALWFAGKHIVDNLFNGKSLLKTSFIYSLTVNKIIWAVFIVVTIAQNFELFSLLFLIPPIIAFLVSVGLTTVSIGLLICWIVELRMKVILKSSQG